MKTYTKDEIGVIFAHMYKTIKDFDDEGEGEYFDNQFKMTAVAFTMNMFLKIIDKKEEDINK